MTPTAQIFAQAMQYHQAGNLQQAEQLYRQVLQAEPRHVAALHLLGVLAFQAGHGDAGVSYIREALRLQPDFAEAHSNLGNMYREQGKLDFAASSYRQALRLKPNLAGTHCNLGNVLKEQGKFDEAMTCYQDAIQAAPEFVDGYRNLGAAQREQGKLAEAAASFERALAVKPDLAEVCIYLGITLQEMGKPEEAAARFQQALRIKPDYAEALNNQGVVLREKGKVKEAVSCWQQALALRPSYVIGLINMGNALQELGNLDQAVSCLEQALRLKPDSAEAHYNLGIVLQDQGKLPESVASLQEALRCNPESFKRHALTAKGVLVHSLQHLCAWEGLEQKAKSLIDAVDANAAQELSPFTFLTLPVATTASQQQRCASSWVQLHCSRVTPLARPPALPRIDGKLKIGYLSADFHNHATAMLTAGLFEKHDRDRFIVHGYSYGPDDGSPMRRRLVQAFDRFVDVRDASNEDAARSIMQDGVDILVDLKGHTKHSRPAILALRPAPIQVNYLGYPGTMGAAFIDYVLVDDFVVPADQQPFYTERLVHLPGCYQVNDSQREIAHNTPDREACGLAPQGFVYCCFNSNYKITPDVFSVWMRLLKAAPGSVLWLLEVTRAGVANLRREAEARGVSGDRLVFAPFLAGPEHLARHRLADLFLDTFPVNAHTTAADAVWAGCPVLTLAGQTMVSRVAGSLLRTVGLSELITTSLPDYESLALRLTQNPKELADLRRRLRAGVVTSSLFDTAKFARNVERAFETMWQLHVAGEKPRGLVRS